MKVKDLQKLLESFNPEMEVKIASYGEFHDTHKIYQETFLQFKDGDVELLSDLSYIDYTEVDGEESFIVIS